MIRAVAAVANHDHVADSTTPRPRPPDVLAEYWRFLRYGLPPLDGGQRAQPLGWFESAEVLNNVYQDWLAWLKSPKTAEWMGQNPRAWHNTRIVMDVLDGR